MNLLNIFKKSSNPNSAKIELGSLVRYVNNAGDVEWANVMHIRPNGDIVIKRGDKLEVYGDSSLINENDKGRFLMKVEYANASLGEMVDLQWWKRNSL